MKRLFARGLDYVAVLAVVAALAVGGTVLSSAKSPATRAPGGSPGPSDPIKVAYTAPPAAEPTSSEHVATVNLTQADAISAVEAFTGALGAATVNGPLDAVDHPYYSVSSEIVEANVDATDGHVRTIEFLERIPSSEGVNTTSAGALDVASAFLADHRVPVSDLSANVQLVDHGGSSEYLVTWTGRVNGALTPDKRSVSVNALTGEVFGLAWFSRAYTPPPAPQISRSDAADRASAAVAAKLNVASEDLVIAYDSAGRQELVWQIEASDSSGYASFLIQVDAISGDTQVVARG